MKIAIFSDIHSNLEALESIKNDINNQELDEVICLGDILAMGPNPKECLDLIMNSNIKLLLGNHELYYLMGTDIDDKMSLGEKEHQKWVASNLNDNHRKYLETCSLEYNLKVNKYNISFKHFFIKNNSKEKYPFHSLKILSDDSINDILKLESSDILFFGHEHKSIEIKTDLIHALGIGSSGCKKDNKTEYIILTIDEYGYSIIKREIEYNRSNFETSINNKEYPEKEFISKVFFGL